MKKTLLIFGLIILGFYANSQNVKGYKVWAVDTIQIDTAKFMATTQVDTNDSILATKAYVLATTGAGNGWDSIIYQPSDGYLVWWYAGARIDSTSTDGRDVMYSDSASIFYSQTDVDSIVTASGAQTVYGITLPINGTLAGSAAAAVEGTDYPTGWNLSASGGNLQVGHNLSRDVANVTVFYNITGASYRQYRNFADAYSGILNISTDSLSIESITQTFTAAKLKINILFE